MMMGLIIEQHLLKQIIQNYLMDQGISQKVSVQDIRLRYLDGETVAIVDADVLFDLDESKLEEDE